ncbi:uncharacterized protein LOC142324251 [Lycorma delicatula]|uniref:uncharacterized protein LOC142324251 n=1 Tax=Lycorma delicatula TaxID=130591 RepID=UPI003F50EDF7
MAERAEPMSLPFNVVEDFNALMEYSKQKLLNSSFDDDDDDYSFLEKEKDKKKRNSHSNIKGVENKATFKPRNTRTYKVRNTRLKRNNQNFVDVIVRDDDYGYCNSQESLNSTPSQNTRNRKNIKKQKKSCDNEVICITDDDDDGNNNAVDVSEASANRSSTYDDLVNVKIIWMCKDGISFKIKRNEPFSIIFKLLSEQKNVSEQEISLFKNDDIVFPDDTPESINLNLLDILTAYISSSANVVLSGKNVRKHGKNSLEVKVLIDKKRNNVLQFFIIKNQKMGPLIEKIANQLDCEKDEIQLWFDGEKVSSSDTTSDLELEGGELFEVRCKKRLNN